MNFRPNFKFSCVIFWGTPISLGVCVLGSLDQCLRRVKFRGSSTPQGPKCSLSKNVHLGGSILAPITFLFVDQSSRSFFAQRGRGSG